MTEELLNKMTPEERAIWDNFCLQIENLQLKLLIVSRNRDEFLGSIIEKYSNPDKQGG